MKAKRLLAASCVGLAVLLCVAIFGTISYQTARGNSAMLKAVGPLTVGTIANGFPQAGNSQALLTVASGGTAGAGVFSLANTTSYSLTGSSLGTIALTGGTGSIPCYNAYLVLSTSNALSSNILIGTNSNACTFPIYATSAGSTGNAYIPLPQLTNINQLYMSLTPSATNTVSTATVNLIYTQ